MIEIKCISSSSGYRTATANEEQYIKGCVAYFSSQIMKSSRPVGNIIPIFHHVKEDCMDAWKNGRVSCKEVGFLYCSMEKRSRRYYGNLISNAEFPYFGELYKGLDLVVPKGYQNDKPAAGLLIEIKNPSGSVIHRFIARSYQDDEFCRQIVDVFLTENILKASRGKQYESRR